MTEKQAKIIGWLGTTLAILMYVSYIPQIIGNLNGNKTSSFLIWCHNLSTYIQFY